GDSARRPRSARCQQRRWPRSQPTSPPAVRTTRDRGQTSRGQASGATPASTALLALSCLLSRRRRESGVLPARASSRVMSSSIDIMKRDARRCQVHLTPDPADGQESPRALLGGFIHPRLWASVRAFVPGITGGSCERDRRSWTALTEMRALSRNN